MSVFKRLYSNVVNRYPKLTGTLPALAGGTVVFILLFPSELPTIVGAVIAGIWLVLFVGSGSTPTQNS